MYSVSFFFEFSKVDSGLLYVQGEKEQRSPILLAQAKYGSVFQPQSIARDIVCGIERSKFQITHGFDGFLLGTIATGMSPVYHWVTLFTEVGSCMYSIWCGE